MDKNLLEPLSHIRHFDLLQMLISLISFHSKVQGTTIGGVWGGDKGEPKILLGILFV